MMSEPTIEILNRQAIGMAGDIKLETKIDGGGQKMLYLGRVGKALNANLDIRRKDIPALIQALKEIQEIDSQKEIFQGHKE